MSQEDARERERIAENETESQKSGYELDAIFEALQTAIRTALDLVDGLTPTEKADIYSGLEMGYRHAAAVIEQESTIRRQANAVNVGFLRTLNDLEKTGQVGWGTTSAFLAKIGVPVRPIVVPESERWLYRIEAESRGVSRNQLTRDAEMAVRFTQDPNFEMWFADEPFPVSAEPSEPITLDGVEYPVAETNAWQTMPNTFPSTVTVGDPESGPGPLWIMSELYKNKPDEDYPASLYKSVGLDPNAISLTDEQKLEALKFAQSPAPSSSYTTWFEANYPASVAAYASASATPDASIADLAESYAHRELFGMAKDASGVPIPSVADEQKVDAYQGSVSPADEAIASHNASLAAVNRALQLKRWREVKSLRGDYLGMAFQPSYDEWLEAEGGTSVTEMSKDVLAEGIAYGFAEELRHDIVESSKRALDRFADAIR